MSSIQANMTGARLSYVVVALEGVVKRPITRWTKKEGLKTTMQEQDAGFLVFFPRGHVLRIKDRAELKHYNLDTPPKIINIQGLHDPNSAVGKLVSSQDEATRRGAMQELEQQVIQIATAKSGRNVMDELNKDVFPVGLRPKKEAA